MVRQGESEDIRTYVYTYPFIQLLPLTKSTEPCSRSRGEDRLMLGENKVFDQIRIKRNPSQNDLALGCRKGINKSSESLD